MSRSDGLTLVELLVGMFILTLLLTATLGVLLAGQDTASGQQRRSLSLDDARSAVTRVADVVSQAAYIYPAGQTLVTGPGLRGPSVSSRVTTGPEALAVLVWDGRDATPARYHAVVFYLAPRARFADDLSGMATAGGAVLVEATTEVPGAPGVVEWPTNTVPTRTWNAPMTESPLADGLDVTTSTLMGTLDAGRNFVGDAGRDDVAFAGGLRGRFPGLDAADALLGAVAVRLTVSAPAPGPVRSGAVRLENVVSARNVPRP